MTIGIPYVDPYEDYGGPYKRGVLRGVHYAWPPHHDIVYALAPYVQSVKALVFGGGSTLNLAKSINPDVVAIYRDYRSGVECPSPVDLNNPSDYYQRLLYYWNDAGVLGGFVDYFEVMNEINNHWLLEPYHYDQLADFSIGLAELMANDGFAMLAFSFGPGNPHVDVFSKLIPYFRWVDSHPVGKWPDGSWKFHGMAMHSAGYMPEWVDKRGFDWINNIWIAGRHELYQEKCLAAGYDLSKFKGPIDITELGWAYGYSEDENTFPVNELNAGVFETAAQYARTGIVTGFNVWNVCSGPTGWLDYTQYVPDMFK